MNKCRKAIWISLIISITLIIFLFYNIISFINGGVINSPWFSGGILFIENPAIGFTSVFLGWIGGTLGTISIILLIYDFKWYYILTLIGQTLTIVDSMITGMFITAISYFIMMTLIIISNKKEKIKISYSVLSLISIIWFVSGFLVYDLLGNINMLSSIDIIASGLSIVGWWLITKENRVGYTLFIINDLLYIVAFTYIGLFVVTCSFVIYLIINIYCLIELSLNKR